MGSLRHVIIGAGPAGLNAIDTIRSIDDACSITLIGDEPPYSRMAIPYYLAAEVKREALVTADQKWLASRGVEQVRGRVTAVEPKTGRVELNGSSWVPYDRLLLATGSRPARPPIPGGDEAGVLNMWNLSDADAYLARGAREVVVLGAGFIGLIVLDAIVKRGAKVTFVELAPQILPRMLDREAARIVEEGLGRQGVSFRKNARTEKIEKPGPGYRLKIAGGDAIECDTLLTATGIRPNIDFLAGSGIEVDGGVLVDARLQTAVPNVYAAGDVAQAPDLLSGARVVHAIQPTAIDHGRVAGANMAGREAAYPGSLSMNILDALGVQACSFGSWEKASGETTTVVNRASGIYRKYVWEGDRMIGAILVGPSAVVSAVNDAGMLRGLIHAKVPLGPWKKYLQDNPLDLRRPFLASGAAESFVEATLLPGEAAKGGRPRMAGPAAARARSPHHATLLLGAG